MKTHIKLEDQDLEIEYRFSERSPETENTPETPPYLHIYKIEYKGIDVTNLLLAFENMNLDHLKYLILQQHE